MNHGKERQTAVRRPDGALLYFRRERFCAAHGWIGVLDIGGDDGWQRQHGRCQPPTILHFPPPPFIPPPTYLTSSAPLVVPKPTPLEDLIELAEKLKKPWEAFTMSPATYEQMKAVTRDMQTANPQLLGFGVRDFAGVEVHRVEKQVEPIRRWTNKSEMIKFLQKMGEIPVKERKGRKKRWAKTKKARRR